MGRTGKGSFRTPGLRRIAKIFFVEITLEFFPKPFRRGVETGDMTLHGVLSLVRDMPNRVAVQEALGCIRLGVANPHTSVALIRAQAALEGGARPQNILKGLEGETGVARGDFFSSVAEQRVRAQCQQLVGAVQPSRPAYPLHPLGQIPVHREPLARYREKITRLRELFGLTFPTALEEIVLSTLESVHRLEERGSIRIFRGLHPVTLRRLLPEAGDSLRDLVSHFRSSRDLPPDHMGFVLRSARLLQGISNAQAVKKGFSEYFLLDLEHGRRSVHRRSFRLAVLLYGIRQERLAHSYVKTVTPELQWNKISRQPFYRGLPYFEPGEIEKVRRFLENPTTLGARIWYERSIRDWSPDEACLAVGMRDKSFDQLERDESYPEAKKLQIISILFGILLDELLRLLLKTYFPALSHPRLEKEPIYIRIEEAKKETERINRYAGTPGTFGEGLHFTRKRKFLSLRNLSRGSRIPPSRLRLMESNRARPTDEELRSLSVALGCKKDALKEASQRTSFEPVSHHRAGRMVSPSGGILAEELTTRPILRVFREIVEKHGVPADRLARILNARFSPGIDLTRFPSYHRFGTLYISNKDDEEKLRGFKMAGRQTMGEVLFFARKTPSRNWTVEEAAEEHLHMNRFILQEIEFNKRRPSNKHLDLFAKVYGLDRIWLEGL